MPAVSFQAQFVSLVESGAKRQTIRARRRDGRDPKRGDPLYLFTAMRTTSCRRLIVPANIGIEIIPVAGRPLGHVVRCKSARPILIEAYGEAIGISIAGRWLGSYYDPWRAERNLARADGFTDGEDMVAWFKRTHGLPFEGFVNRW